MPMGQQRLVALIKEVVGEHPDGVAEDDLKAEVWRRLTQAERDWVTARGRDRPITLPEFVPYDSLLTKRERVAFFVRRVRREHERLARLAIRSPDEETGLRFTALVIELLGDEEEA
jgi:hypothetical protein